MDRSPVQGDPPNIYNQDSESGKRTVRIDLSCHTRKINQDQMDGACRKKLRDDSCIHSSGRENITEDTTSQTQKLAGE
jgi:hypothetical protein